MPPPSSHLDICRWSSRPLESCGTFYGVLNAADPGLQSGPANLTFRRKEATDVNHHVDRYNRRRNGDHGYGPHSAAPAPKVAVKPRPESRSWPFLNATLFRAFTQGDSAHETARASAFRDG